MPSRFSYGLKPNPATRSVTRPGFLCLCHRLLRLRPGFVRTPQQTTLYLPIPRYDTNSYIPFFHFLLCLRCIKFRRTAVGKGKRKNIKKPLI